MTPTTTVTIDARAIGDISSASAQMLHDGDISARNTLEQPERVGLVTNDSLVVDGGSITITLPPVSWTAVSLA